MTRIREQKGFTLVELLVVIAIILILAAILFPVFAKVREKAQQTRCASNLRSIGSACAMYQDDNSQMLPPVANPWRSGNLWPDLIDPYLKQLKGAAFAGNNTGPMYRCKSAPEEEARASWRWPRSYGMNTYCGLGHTTLSRARLVPLSKVKYPSKTLRVTEAWEIPEDPDEQSQGGSAYAPMPNMLAGGSEFQPGAPGWHNGTNNVLWIDGHVSVMKATTGGRSANTKAEVMFDDGRTSYGRVWCRLEGPKEFNERSQPI